VYSLGTRQLTGCCQLSLKQSLLSEEIQQKFSS
jgi:hypothetical protein